MDTTEHGPACQHCQHIAETNLRVLKHEADTPMRGHDEDGRCCLIARSGGEDR